MDSATKLTIAEFQKHIFDRYAKVDRERGWPKTFAYFIEEVGELATALAGDDRANLEEEFADVDDRVHFRDGEFRGGIHAASLYRQPDANRTA